MWQIVRRITDEILGVKGLIYGFLTQLMLIVLKFHILL